MKNAETQISGTATDTNAEFKTKYNLAIWSYGHNKVSPKQSSLDTDGGIILRNKKGDVLKVFPEEQLNVIIDRQEHIRQEQEKELKMIREIEEKERSIRRKFKSHSFDRMKELLKGELGIDLEKRTWTSFARNGRYTNAYTDVEYTIFKDGVKFADRIFKTLFDLAIFLENYYSKCTPKAIVRAKKSHCIDNDWIAKKEGILA